MSAGTRAAAARSGFALGLPVECSHNGRSAATTAAAAPRSGFVLGLPVECSHNGGGAAQRVCSRAPGGVQPQRPRLLSGSRRSAAIRLAAAPPSGFALGSPVGCSRNAQRVCPRLPAGAQPGGWRQRRPAGLLSAPRWGAAITRSGFVLGFPPERSQEDGGSSRPLRNTLYASTKQNKLIFSHSPARPQISNTANTHASRPEESRPEVLILSRENKTRAPRWRPARKFRYPATRAERRRHARVPPGSPHARPGTKALAPPTRPARKSPARKF